MTDDSTTKPEPTDAAPKPTKEKLRTIMEAASALTALGDEDEVNGSRPNSPKETDPTKKTAVNSEEPPKAETEEAVDHGKDNNSNKRYLPEHKKPDAAPTFPEKLMKLMNYAEEQCKKDKDFCVSWLEDGKSFVIRNPDGFTRQVVPKFFKQTKFSSFTRKLYRWGFRQINRGIGPDDPIIFGNEFFVRENEELMAKMRSVTAAGTRKQEQARVVPFGKRTFDGGMFDPSFQDPKRFMFDQYFQQKAMMHQNPSLYGGMSAQGTMPLSSAMRAPMGGMGDYHQQQQQHHHMQMQQQMQGMQPNQAVFPMNNPAKGYSDMMHGGNMAGMQGGNHQGMMMNHQQQFMQQQQSPQQHHHHHQHQGMMVPNGAGGNGGYHNNQSTAEIVNAAIAALRYAN